MQVSIQALEAKKTKLGKYLTTSCFYISEREQEKMQRNKTQIIENEKNTLEKNVQRITLEIDQYNYV